MQNKNLWLLGKLAKSYGDELIARGYTLNAIFDGNKQYPKFSFTQSISANFTSKESLLASLQGHNIQVDGILAQGFENYVLPSAWLSNHYKIPGLSEEAALAATDKVLMRQKFKEYDADITPDFQEVSDWEEVAAFAKTHTFPLVLKPAHLAKSLLVTKNDNLEELKQNFNNSQNILPELYKKYGAKGRSPKLLIEEFLKGSAHSIDAIIERDQTIHLLDIVDYVVGYEIGIPDNFHFARLMPTQLDTQTQAKFKEIAEKGIRALGLTSSQAHIEIIVTAQGPKIIEIGARAGGYRARMYQEANGIDYFSAIFNTALGQSFDVKKTKNNYCAVLEVFPQQDGLLKEIIHLEDLKQHLATQYVRVMNQPGDAVGLAKNGFKAVLIVMLVSENRQVFEEAYNLAKDTTKILTS